MTLALHPEATPDEQVLRWRYSDAANAPSVGVLISVPSELAQLGIDGATSQPGQLLLKAATGISWTDIGSAVRTQLTALLATPQPCWHVRPFADEEQPGEDVDDDAIRAAAQDVLDQQLAGLTSSHGGGIELLDVTDGVVRVRLTGACHGCPAAAMTLHRRFETALRGKVSGVVRVTSEPGNVCQEGAKNARSLRFLGLPHEQNRRRND